MPSPVSMAGKPQAARPATRRYVFKAAWKRWAMGLIDALGTLLFAMRRRPAWDVVAIRRVLIVRMDQIGDAIFATSAMRYAQELLPEAKIDVLVGPAAKDLAGQFPHARDILISPANWFVKGLGLLGNLRAARALISQLKGGQYDLAVDLRGDFRNIAMLRMAGIPRVLGYGISGGGFMLDRGIPYDFMAHQVDLNLRLIARITNARPPMRESFLPKLHCPTPTRKRVRRHRFWQGYMRHVLVHPEAGYPSKRWSKERFRSLMQSLGEQGCKVALIGLEKDNLAKWMEHVLDLRGKIGLQELSAWIGEADLLVGSDSAPVHMAAALGTPCIVLFSGANDVMRWRPLGPQTRVLTHAVPCSPCESRRCLMPRHACMEEISVEEVLATLREEVAV